MCNVKESAFSRPNGASYALTRGRQMPPSIRLIGTGRESIGRIRPEPGCALVSLSLIEASQYQTSRPSWYGKCSTQSGLVFRNPKLYGPGAVGVVILPDIRGLYSFYEQLAEGSADAGHPAIAFDFFGRTAGTGIRGDDFDFQPHVAQTRLDQLQADTAERLVT